MEQSGSLLALRDTYRARLRQDLRATALLDELFKNPYVSAARVAALLGVTVPTATKAIRTLEGAGILQESTGREWGKIWVARPIFDAVERPAEAPPAEASASEGGG